MKPLFDAVKQVAAIDGVPVFAGPFVPPGQRRAHSLHEIPYRACFNPLLPRMFIERLTRRGDTVYDPFGGRGTTALEALLLDRRGISQDISPLHAAFACPRIRPRVAVEEVRDWLRRIDWRDAGEPDRDLTPWFHPDTIRHIMVLRKVTRATWHGDPVAAWVRMVVLARLTGHSAGYLSGYTLPPNMQTTAERQRKINARHGPPPPKKAPAIILRKTRSLLRDLTAARALRMLARDGAAFTGDAADPPGYPADLVFTSPPFLDEVDYEANTDLRRWFLGEPGGRPTVLRSLPAWRAFMVPVLERLHDTLRHRRGWLCIEAGRVRKGNIDLAGELLSILPSGFEPVGIYENTVPFSKTAHIQGVKNGRDGTNSWRVLVARVA